MADAAKNMAVIGEEASFSGIFKGHDLIVLGRFEGQIEVGGRLRVGPKGHAKANVRAWTQGGGTTLFLQVLAGHVWRYTPCYL